MKMYIKDGNIIAEGTAIEWNGKTVINPTHEIYLAAGWVEYTPPTPEPILPTVEELVESALRHGADGGNPTYSINQEFEIQRLRDTHPEEFQIYFDRVEECIAWANEQPHRETKEIL